MRIAALVLFSLFALNILAEAGSGHCKESFAPDAHISAGSALQAAGHPASADDGDTHACHFGHCGHLMLPLVPAAFTAAEFSVLRPAPAQSRVWRALSPLLRPPIA
jgi:hypothetical protein